ncbi:MAG: hypothetical protein AMXMBFR13_50150 [Phycisphaerae bacterium]
MAVDKHKDILTTGQVAKICKVAPRTVSKWFDTGQLRGYRIPGSKDRRIPLQQLIRFMRAHGIPLNGLATGLTRVLIVDAEAELTGLIRKALTESGNYEVQVAESVFEAGAITERFQPNILLVNLDLPGVEGKALSRFFAGHAELQTTRTIAMSASLTENDRQTLLQQGFDNCIARPFTIRQLGEVIEQTLPGQG